MIAKMRNAGVRWRAMCAAVAVHAADAGGQVTACWPFANTRPQAGEWRPLLKHVAADDYRWAIWLTITVAAALLALTAHALA